MYRLRLSAALVLALIVLVPVGAYAQDNVAMSFQTISSDGQTTDLTLTVAGDLARMDMGSDAAMIWSPDWWRLVQKAEQKCIEFDPEMMRRMAEMMRNMPGVPDVQQEMNDFDPASFTFERTGRTDTVMGFEVFEVKFTSGQGDSGFLWLSTDVEYGMFEIMSKMLVHLEQLAGPMMRGGPGGGNPAARMQRYMQYAKAQGMPDGKVLRMNADDGTSFEVTGWEEGPFGAETWESPYRCEAMQIPFQR